MASKATQTTLSAQVKVQALSAKDQFWWKNNTGSDSIKPPQAELKPSEKLITDWKQRNPSIKIVVEIKNLASPTFNFLQRVHGLQNPCHGEKRQTWANQHWWSNCLFWPEHNQSFHHQEKWQKGCLSSSGFRNFDKTKQGLTKRSTEKKKKHA